MKHISVLILCVLLTFALTACSDSAPKTQNTQTAAVVSESTASSTEAPTQAPTQEPTQEPAAQLAPVEIALLDSYPFEKDGETHTFIALALRAPEESRWSLRTKGGELIDTFINSYGYYSVPNAVEGEKYCILLFKELVGTYDPADLALSVTYTVPGGAETTELFDDWGACVAPEDRSKYGIHDFGGFIGFVDDVSAIGDAEFLNIEFNIASIPFGGNDETTAYTNAAEQFKFFAKDGTPIAEALGYSQYEIFNRNLWVDLKFAIQDGEPDGKTGAEQFEKSIGYMEYTRDDGEVIHIDIYL